MADIFVPYSRTDKARVAPLVAALEAQGWSVWWDPEITPGDEFDALIGAQLEAARVVVVVWSPASVDSRWVKGEARDAADRGVLVPVRFENARLPIDVRAIHTIDLDDWAGSRESAAFRALATALEGKLKRSAVKAAAPALKDKRPAVVVCVLPFANMSGDPEQAYFSDGITEDIITDLSKISALHVISRNTAFTFKGKAVDVGQVAAQLKVTHVLEGSVRKAAGRVRITAQLIDGSNDSHLWAERYDRDLNDIFAIQDEISHAIVAALKVKLLPEEKKAIERHGTDNVDAYNLFLLARQSYDTGFEGDARRLDAIIRICRRAVEIDPNYAEAWALIGMAEMLLRSTMDRGGDGGLAAAERALELNADLAEAHAVKARIFSEEKRHDEASREIETALRLDPESHQVNKCAALLRFRQQRLEESVRYFEKAVALEDGDFGAAGMLITCYLALGNPEAARRSAKITLARAEKVLAHDPNNGSAMGHGSWALAALGEGERAKDWMKRALF